MRVFLGLRSPEIPHSWSENERADFYEGHGEGGNHKREIFLRYSSREIPSILRLLRTMNCGISFSLGMIIGRKIPGL